MRKAFTMIELIFVIVIIGILSAVAVPKLAATRDDAKHAALKTNTKICIDDLVGSYKGNNILTPINSMPACVEARAQGAVIEYSGDDINISSVDASMDGAYVYKGSRVIY